MSCSAESQLRWIIKVEHEASSWPAAELIQQHQQSLKICGLEVSDLAPSGVPGFLRMTLAAPITAEQKNCILQQSGVLSLEEDAIMRPADGGNMMRSY
ncbi:hypothetical protein GCM10011297_34870 [Bacterioplanes sanyensis]|nr:hypothetical protein GCM10011297_34870 [Bacterioplanes sanyensis]